MKRVCLLAAGLLTLAAPGCHRGSCPGTTNTTSATVTPAPAQPELTSAELSGAPTSDATAGPVAGTDATAGPAARTTAKATPAPAARTATGPVDISGPTPAAPTTGETTAGTTPAAPTPAEDENAPATTTTTAAPLVAPGLDNAVSGGVANTGAPFNYGSPYDNTVYGGGGGGPAPMIRAYRPIGGAMRPGAASNPDTTSGAR